MKYWTAVADTASQGGKAYPTLNDFGYSNDEVYGIELIIGIAAVVAILVILIVCLRNWYLRRRN
jgi:hypothetical protein